MLDHDVAAGGGRAEGAGSPRGESKIEDTPDGAPVTQLVHAGGPKNTDSLGRGKNTQGHIQGNPYPFANCTTSVNEATEEHLRRNHKGSWRRPRRYLGRRNQNCAGSEEA